MTNPKIHFLNVNSGDCSLLERPSGRVTMIDICGGNITAEDVAKSSFSESRTDKPRGNFAMCSKPTNPVEYLKSKGLTNIWRFILSHPDMDHMDGIKQLFETITVEHFWDSKVRRDKPDFGAGGAYLEEDWDFYDELISGDIAGTKVISPLAGANGQFWNADDDDGKGNGDYLSILSPNQTLVDSANDNGDINDASYVIVYRSSAGNIIFAGDSNDNTWEYILENHKETVSNAAVLIAPHHGRKSGRDYSFLDVVKPRISFFGCASSKNLAYSAWDYRNLLYFTNNQCGNVHMHPRNKKIEIFIENNNYANSYTNNNTYKEDGHWFLCHV